MTTAIVVFVKTPELSPTKTRLAKGIGQTNSLDFYRMCLRATRKYTSQIETQHSFYWAVAEKKGLDSSYWEGDYTIWQGIGDLGNRLHKVYSDLITEYDQVVFLGADSPHLNASYLTQSLEKFKSSKRSYLIGRSVDGGFYLFAGKKSIDEAIWTKVNYSRNTTAQELMSSLASSGDFLEMEESFDIDEVKDLDSLVAIDRSNISQELDFILKWLDGAQFNAL